jgi:hypothetical protein
MKYSILIFALLLFATSCSQNNEQSATVQLPKVSDEFKSYKLDLDLPHEQFADLIESVEVVRLEETDSSLLSYIRNFQKTGKYLVFNASNQESDVFVFDNTGGFVRKINRQGEGPEEYNEITDLWLETDTLVIYSRNRKTVRRYDLEGNFIMSERLPIMAEHIYSYPKGYAMEMNYRLINDTSQYRYASLNNDLELSGTYQKVDNKMEMGLYLSNNPIAPYKDGVTLFRMMSDTVYNLNEKGFLPFLHFDFGSDWYWKDGNDVLPEFADAMMTTDKVWRALAFLNDTKVWVQPYNGYGQEKAISTFLIDRSTGSVKAINMRKADSSEGVGYVLGWDGDQLIFTVQSPDMGSFLSQLKGDQITYRQGTTLEEIESSENPVLMWVKFKK